MGKGFGGRACTQIVVTAKWSLLKPKELKMPILGYIKQIRTQAKNPELIPSLLESVRSTRQNHDDPALQELEADLLKEMDAPPKLLWPGSSAKSL